MKIVGFAEGGDAILFSIAIGVFTIDLQLERIRKLCEDDGEAHSFVPISTVYIQNYTKLKRAQQLFNKGYEVT
jgi:hypothetical protein